MTDHFLSPKMFLRDLLVNILSGLAGGALVGIFSGKLWLGILFFCIILSVLFFFWLWKKHERIIKLIITGTAGYYYSFDLDENPKVWKEAKRSFCYLGISSDSILERFRQWIETNPVSSYRILLMKPASKSLKRQEAFQKGHDLDVKLEELPKEARKTLDEAVEATTQRINSAIAILKNSSPYKDGRMKIKVYDEFTPWWVYLIDEHKAYVGILEKGKRGSDSPVVIIEKNKKYTSPFDAFKNNWERIWQNAIDA